MKQQIIDGNKKIAEFDGLTKDTYGKFFKNGVQIVLAVVRI